MWSSFTDVPEPPDDPLALASWAQRIVALDLRRIIRGESNRQLSQEIRAAGRTIAALMPLERIHKAEGVIRSAGEQRKDRPNKAEVVNVAGVAATPLSGAPPRGRRSEQ